MFFGSTFIAGRVLAQNLPPFTSSFLRFFVAALFLIIFLLSRSTKIPSIDFKTFLQILVLALSGIAGYNYFFFSGLKLIDASQASIIVSLNPALISILSFLFFQEKLNPVKIFGILLSLLGALIVITKGQLNLLLTGNIGIGELYILGCVICWSTFTIISKLVIQRIAPLIAITLACVMGAILLFIPAWQEGQLFNFTHFGLEVWLSILALSILGTVLAYIWYYEGIDKIGTSRTGIFINFVPVWATAMAILILDEQITISFIIGSLIVLSGVFLVNLKLKS
jgi:drug/metabolite transporter (DMT)-like permease